MYIAGDIIKYALKLNTAKRWYPITKGEDDSASSLWISAAELAPIGSLWISQLHTSTRNRVSMRCQAETKALGLRKASKERETLIHFALIYLKNLQF